MRYLEGFFFSSDQPDALLFGSHDPWLVALSVSIAILSSLMALQVAGIARRAQSGWHRHVALLSGSVALAGGIWSMHFIGMLAFSFCTTVHYSTGLTLVSMLPSLAASWVALHVLTRPRIGAATLILGGSLMGAGIGAMHYSGMAAMQMAPLLRYDPFGFLLSVFVAIALSMLALWIRYGLKRWISSGSSLVISAIVMGLAISGMHYTGMSGARFVGAEEVGAGRSDVAFLAGAVTVVTLMLTVLVAITNGLLRFRQLYTQLQAHESRLRATLDTAVDGVVTFDDNGRIQACNPALEKMLGYDAKALIGQSVARIIPSLDRDSTVGAVVPEKGAVGKGRQETAIRFDGAEVPVRLALGRAELPDGALYLGYVTDLTESKQMEQALRDSELQFRSLIRNIPGVSFRCLMDEDWSVLFISDAVERLTGWPAEDFVTKRQSFIRLFHPDDLGRVEAIIREAIKKGVGYTAEFRLFDRAGRERWVQESGSVILDQSGCVRWIDGVMLDITDTKRRNAEFEATVRAISRALGVIEFDMNGIILTANDNFLRMMGYRLDELQGRHHRMFCDPEYIYGPAYQEFWHSLASGTLNAGEYRRRGKDGRVRWIQATYNPVFDSDGKPFKVVKFATDVSLRHEMETALREAKDRAEQAAASKTTFLANMSHEIRTPMNAIIGFTELLLDSELDSAQRGHLNTVRYSARSLLGLLNDILDTAKLEKGALELEQVDFSLFDLCQHICTSLRLSAQAKGLTLTLDYQPGLARYFNGDPLRIQQVLTNLVGNAVKFTETGGVRLEVSEEGDEIHFAVRDSGIGIPEDRLERIFAPFAQADASMSRRFGGTGLGTTIAQQLVDLMDGRLRAESKLGEGSVFHVFVPLAFASGAPEREGTFNENLSPLHILAADDVPQNLQLLSLSLERRGHTVVTARNGEEVVVAFQQEQFDLLLLDVQMPEVDGLEAAKRIRALEVGQSRPRVPIIALTASVLEEDRVAARNAGMDGFASKPLEVDKLIREIARVTGHHPSFPEVVAAVELTDPHAIIDWAQGLQLWGGRDKLLTAVRRFYGDNRRAAVSIAELNANGLFVEASEAIHKIRGTSGNLSLVHICKLAGQLEHAFRGKPKTRPIEVLIEELAGAFDALGHELDRLAPPARLSSAVDGIEPSELATLAEQLRQSLQRGELDDQVLECLIGVLVAQGRRDEVDDIDRAINDFDFALADELLGKLIATLSPAAEEC
ncbi:PAS domain S-box protein [Pseudomonas sp. Marseille-QA0892]